MLAHNLDYLYVHYKQVKDDGSTPVLITWLEKVRV